MNLNNSYILLIMLAIILLAAKYYLPNSSFIIEYVPNIISEIIGILLTVFLIDCVIKRYQEKENNKFQMIGFKQLRAPLNNINNLLLNMYKASLCHLPKVAPHDVKDLFTEDYYTSIGFLDFSKDAPVFPEINWFDYVHRECTEFRSNIDNIVGKFGTYFGPDLVDLLIRIKDSSLVLIMSQFRSILSVDAKLGVKRNYNILGAKGFKDIIIPFVDNYISLVEIYNRNVEKDLRISCENFTWGEHLAPKLGSGRLNGT